MDEPKQLRPMSELEEALRLLLIDLGGIYIGEIPPSGFVVLNAKWMSSDDWNRNQSQDPSQSIHEGEDVDIGCYHRNQGGE
jgi:hypothetical protein